MCFGLGFEFNPRANKVRWTKEQLITIFRSHDSDNDGQLSWDEVKAAFKYLGSRCSYFRTARAFDYADWDKNGFINLSNDEFTKLLEYAFSCGYYAL